MSFWECEVAEWFSVPDSLCPDLGDSERKCDTRVCSRNADVPRQLLSVSRAEPQAEARTCPNWDSSDQGAEGWTFHPKTTQACTCFWAQMFVRIFYNRWMCRETEPCPRCCQTSRPCSQAEKTASSWVLYKPSLHRLLEPVWLIVPRGSWQDRSCPPPSVRGEEGWWGHIPERGRPCSGDGLCVRGQWRFPVWCFLTAAAGLGESIS